MKKQKDMFQGGYVGLLLFVITLGIMFFLIWKYEYHGFDTGGAKTATQKVETPEEFQAIQAAQNAKNILESQSHQAAQIQVQ